MTNLGSKKQKFNNVKNVKFDKGVLSFTRGGVTHMFNNVHDIKTNNNELDFSINPLFACPFNVGDFIVHIPTNTCRLVTDIKSNNEIYMAYFSSNNKLNYTNKFINTVRRVKNAKDYDSFRLASEKEIKKFIDILKENKNLLFDRVNSKIYDIDTEDFYKKGDYIVYDEEFLGQYNGIILIDDIPQAIEMNPIEEPTQSYSIEDLNEVRKVTPFEMKLINEYVLK